MILRTRSAHFSTSMKICGFLTALLLASSAFAAEKPIAIAIFPFAAPGRGRDNIVTDALTAELSKDARFAIFERTNLSRVMAEQAMGLSGEIDPETAARVGRLVGAKVLILGRRIGNVTKRPGAATIQTVIARIMNVETGRVYTETLQAPNSGQGAMRKLAAELAEKIARTIAEHAAELLEGAMTRGELIEQIVRSIEGDKRPGVMIRINESRAGKTSVQSTAETELGFIFQKAGFTLVDDLSARPPDVEITGEAISESGEKHGELFSGRASLEIKVRERATGKILSFERESGAALDTGEQTAVNLALEKAADALAARLVPMLSR
jgi:hypothetical protein